MVAPETLVCSSWEGTTKGIDPFISNEIVMFFVATRRSDVAIGGMLQMYRYRYALLSERRNGR